MAALSPETVLVVGADGVGPASRPASPVYAGKAVIRFEQSVSGLPGAWVLTGESRDGGKLIYASAETGERVAVPNIWYNQSGATRAKALRFSAENCDRQAARHRLDAKPWSETEAKRAEADAARLRSLADECERTGKALA